MDESCILIPFSSIAQFITEGNEFWTLSDATESVYEGMIHSLSVMLDTIIYCPCFF